MAKEKKSTQQPSKKGDGQRINRSWDTPSRPITPTPAGSVPPDTPPACATACAKACGYTGETTTPRQKIVIFLVNRHKARLIHCGRACPNPLPQTPLDNPHSDTT